MILSNVNIGTGPSAGDGDPLRTAFGIINNNFAIVNANVSSLTNSVPSVAGRTGNVVLTINDIVGLNTTYTSQANTTAANIAMRGYVDATISANIATLVDLAPNTLDTIRELADAIGDDPNFAVNVALSVSTANTKMRSYVDGQILAANAGVTAANLGMRGYVDSVAGGGYSNVNTLAYLTTNSYATQSYVNLANTSLKSYIDGQITAANTNANTSQLWNAGYTLRVSSTNGNVTLPLGATIGTISGATEVKPASGGVVQLRSDNNLNRVQANDNDVSIYGGDSLWKFDYFGKLTLPSGANITAYVDGITTIRDGEGVEIDINPNNGFSTTVANGTKVLANGHSWMFGLDGNLTAPGSIIPSANVSYDLGNVTHRWRDLWLSGSTIHIGNANISVSNGSIQSSAPIRADITGNITAGNITVSGNTISIGGATLDVSSGTLESSVPISTTNLTINGPRLDFVQGAYVEESEIAGNPGYYGLALNSPSNGVVGLNALDVNTQVTSSVIVSNVAIQINVANSTPSGNALMWYFDNTGAVTFPDGTTQATAGSGTATGIASAETITITNANTSNVADILIQSGDDITLQAKDRLPGNDAEGGDINIYAGDGCDDDGVAGTSSAGDVTIEGGRGGAGDVTSGGSGGFVAIRGGAGGSASLTASAGSGSSISLTAGDAGSNGGDPNLGNLGGDVNIRAGDTNNASDNGGIITLTTGTNVDGANRIAGYVEINIPISNIGEGGTWTFDGTGRVFNTPQNAEIFGAGAGNLTVGSAGNTLIRSLNYNSLVPYTWQFSDLGVLTLPGEGVIQSLDDTVTLVSLNTTSGYANSVYLGSGGGLGFNDQSVGSNWLEIFRSGATPEITSPTGNLKITTVVTGVSSNTWTYGTDGSITFPDNTVQTTAWTGSGGYSNVQVATYLPTYTGNINASNVTSTTLHITDSTPATGPGQGAVQIDGAATISGNVFIQSSVNIVGNIDVYGQAQLGNIKLRYGTLIEDSSNGQVVINGNISAGNIFASGTSGQIGYSNGGFVQQATSNATQVTSHFNSGNIQLMSINLGVNAAHTVAFACNKLTTNDMLLIKHVSGGLTSVYIDAYVASDGLAVIWMRNISGQDTGDFIPMLKYAIIQAPSS